MTDFEDATPLQRLHAIERWETEYQRFTAEYEELSGYKMESDFLEGWRACYVQLNILTVKEED